MFPVFLWNLETELELDHVYGVKKLDFSPHPMLRQLAIGPAKGVKSVSLEGLRHLRELALACMSRLTHISGSDFHRTVTLLDIRASHSIPRATLTAFTKLEKVRIGMRSELTASDFPRCRPRSFECLCNGWSPFAGVTRNP